MSSSIPPVTASTSAAAMVDETSSNKRRRTAMPAAPVPVSATVVVPAEDPVVQEIQAKFSLPLQRLILSYAGDPSITMDHQTYRLILEAYNEDGLLSRFLIDPTAIPEN